MSATPPVAGYADATSVRPGGTIRFHVTTAPAARYRIEISRLGWYGGRGDVWRHAWSERTSTTAARATAWGSTSPRDRRRSRHRRGAGGVVDDRRADGPGWLEQRVLPRGVPADAAGPLRAGQALLRSSSRRPSAIIPRSWFRSRRIRGRRTTCWGGIELYTQPGAPRANRVSFDRPLDARLLFDWEYPLVRFLERGNWDVSYATDDDVDADPQMLRNHVLDMSAGHDEYWTRPDARRLGARAGRRASTLPSRAQMPASGRCATRTVRRTMIGYKYCADPDPDQAEKTTQFRRLKPPRPECQMIGVEFQGLVLIRRNIDAVADATVAAGFLVRRYGSAARLGDHRDRWGRDGFDHAWLPRPASHASCCSTRSAPRGRNADAGEPSATRRVPEREAFGPARCSSPGASIRGETRDTRTENRACPPSPRPTSGCKPP